MKIIKFYSYVLSSIMLFMFGIVAISSSFSDHGMSKANANIASNTSEIKIIRQVETFSSSENSTDVLAYEVRFLS